jgi:cell division protein DivIC
VARLNRWEAFVEKVPPPLRNKYILTTTVFVLWMLIFDRNSIWSQYTLQNTLEMMQKKKTYFEGQIREDTKSQKELFSDDAGLEQFAREHHLMKKSDEDVFVFEKVK